MTNLRDAIEALERGEGRRETLATMIIDRARQQAEQLDYSFEEALGDVMGSLLYEVDAELFTQGDRLPCTRDSLFYRYLDRQICEWFL